MRSAKFIDLETQRRALMGMQAYHPADEDMGELLADAEYHYKGDCAYCRAVALIQAVTEGLEANQNRARDGGTKAAS